MVDPSVSQAASAADSTQQTQSSSKQQSAHFDPDVIFGGDPDVLSSMEPTAFDPIDPETGKVIAHTQETLDPFFHDDPNVSTNTEEEAVAAMQAQINIPPLDSQDVTVDTQDAGQDLDESDHMPPSPFVQDDLSQDFGHRVDTPVQSQEDIDNPAASSSLSDVEVVKDDPFQEQKIDTDRSNVAFSSDTIEVADVSDDRYQDIEQDLEESTQGLLEDQSTDNNESEIVDTKSLDDVVTTDIIQSSDDATRDQSDLDSTDSSLQESDILPIVDDSTTDTSEPSTAQTAVSDTFSQNMAVGDTPESDDPFVNSTIAPAADYYDPFLDDYNASVQEFDGEIDSEQVNDSKKLESSILQDDRIQQTYEQEEADSTIKSSVDTVDEQDSEIQEQLEQDGKDTLIDMDENVGSQNPLEEESSLAEQDPIVSESDEQDVADDTVINDLDISSSDDVVDPFLRDSDHDHGDIAENGKLQAQNSWELDGAQKKIEEAPEEVGEEQVEKSQENQEESPGEIESSEEVESAELLGEEDENGKGNIERATDEKRSEDTISEEKQESLEEVVSEEGEEDQMPQENGYEVGKSDELQESREESSEEIDQSLNIVDPSDDTTDKPVIQGLVDDFVDPFLQDNTIVQDDKESGMSDEIPQPQMDQEELDKIDNTKEDLEDGEEKSEISQEEKDLEMLQESPEDEKGDELLEEEVRSEENIEESPEEHTQEENADGAVVQQTVDEVAADTTVDSDTSDLVQTFYRLQQSISTVHEQQGNRADFQIIGSDNDAVLIAYTFALLDDARHVVVTKEQTNRSDDTQSSNVLRFVLTQDNTLELYVDDVLLFTEEQLNDSVKDRMQVLDKLNKFTFLVNTYASDLSVQARANQDQKEAKDTFQQF